MDDAELAAAIADEAGCLLTALADAGRLTGKALGDEGDRRANDLILARLAADRPHDAILSEESADGPARLSARRVWIVDPLDGTREYAAARDDWAVHVGLAVDGVPSAGAVAVPRRGLVLSSAAPPPLPPESEPLRIITSRTRPAPIAAYAAEQLGARLIRMGSAGAKVAAVMLGEADAYLHSGEQSEWDNLAPVAAALAAGLHCSRLDGTPLRYNRANVIVPDLLVCHPGRAAALVSLAAAFEGSRDP